MPCLLYVSLFIAFLIHSRCEGSPQKEDVTSVVDGSTSYSSQETNRPSVSSSFLSTVTTTSPSASWLGMASSTSALIPSTTSYSLSTSSSTAAISRYKPIFSSTFSEHLLSISSDFTVVSLAYSYSNITVLAPTTVTTQAFRYITPASLTASTSTGCTIHYQPSITSSSTSIPGTNTSAPGSEDLSTSLSRPTITALAVFAFLTALIVAIYLFQKWQSRKGSSNQDFWGKYDDFMNRDKEKVLPYSIGHSNPFEGDDTPAGFGGSSFGEKSGETFQPQFMKDNTVDQRHPASFMKISDGKLRQDDHIFVAELQEKHSVADSMSPYP